MRELVKRLEVLEGQQFTPDAVDVILVELVSPGLAPRELRTLTHEGVSGRRVWERLEGETEAKFKARACGEVPRVRVGVPVLLSGA